MERTNGKTNGTANGHDDKTTPRIVQDLEGACVRFVERAIGFKLDHTPETLPVLDHYVDQARTAARERPETKTLVAPAVGAYLGEIVRRQFGGSWRLEDTNDPRSFRVELEPVYLVLRPIELASRALDLPETKTVEPAPQQKSDEDEEDEDDDDTADARTATAPELTSDPQEDLGPALLELDEDDRAAVGERLAALPPVPDTQYYAPSTYLELVEIVVEALRARRTAAGMEADAHLEPDDYA